MVQKKIQSGRKENDAFDELQRFFHHLYYSKNISHVSDPIESEEIAFQ